MLTNINVFIPFLSAAMTAMRASPESSASTLPRKRGKDSAKAPTDAPAVGIEGDWRYIPRDVLGYYVKNKKIPVKTIDMGPKVPCFRLVMLHLPVMSPACRRELLCRSTRWKMLEPSKRTDCHRGREGASSQQKQGRRRT